MKKETFSEMLGVPIITRKTEAFPFVHSLVLAVYSVFMSLRINVHLFPQGLTIRVVLFSGIV